jgi:DNA invertase Pin-like site-specific DNA recombinase
VDYYTKFIQEHPDWEYITVYTDEGILAVNTKKRDGFNQMVQDALDGKLDLIVTKSVSRFARNTVDSLQTVRALKEKGVEIFFEEQNIWTLDSKGELLITIMSSLPQEESRNISENVTWGQRKRTADGKISLPYAHFLGYRRGEDGLPEIVEVEAETVRLIYRLFLEGKTAHGIAKTLTGSGVPTPAGKEKWQACVIRSILQNEKYEGHALLQKGYTEDFLTKKRRKNHGEIQQYWVENSHPAIVSPEVYDMVQAELKRRNSRKGRYSGSGIFAGKLICGDCNSYFGQKVWHSTTQYRRVIWRCNHKYEEGCATPHLYESDLKARFVAAANQLLAEQKTLSADFAEIRAAIFDTAALEKEAAKSRHAELSETITDSKARRQAAGVFLEKSKNASPHWRNSTSNAGTPWWTASPFAAMGGWCFGLRMGRRSRGKSGHSLKLASYGLRVIFC